VVKEQVVKSFVSTEVRILQQHHILSSGHFHEVQNFFCNFNHLRLRSTSSISSAGGEFYSVSNRCQPPLQPLSIDSTEAPTGSNHHPVSPAHCTWLSPNYNLYF
ncbi:MAG TPA: hypothetical protein VJ047_06340, partial [Pseudomonas sp.]|nr:hypothetical protein [Pseudomonas sp.]